MQDPDDVVGRAAPDRHAGVRALQDLAHHARRRTVGIDGTHIGAMDHHVRDLELVQVEQSADPVAVLLHHLSLARQPVDGLAQLVVGTATLRPVDQLESRSARSGLRRITAAAAASRSTATATRRADHGRQRPPPGTPAPRLPDVAGDEGCADAARQDEGQRAARHLLVLGDEAEQRFGVRQPARHVGHADTATRRRRDAPPPAPRRRGSHRLSRTENRCASAMPDRYRPRRGPAGRRHSWSPPRARGRRYGRD